MAYVYKHIRHDTNVVFYVGISSDKNYSRAHSKKGRSSFWKNITSLSKYSVEIVSDNLSWQEACKKEKELIQLYGRRDLNTGTLCNHTEGGDGVHGYKHSQERLNRISINSSGANNPKSKACIHFDTGIEYKCLKDACNLLNLNYGSQASAIKRQTSTAQFYFINNKFKRKTRKDVSLSLSKSRQLKWQKKLSTNQETQVQ